MFLPHIHTGLTFDAAKRSYRDVALRVRDGNSSWLFVVFELSMTAFASHLAPTICFQPRDYVGAFHDAYKYTLAVKSATPRDVRIYQFQ
jgi:hypothetical protein